MWMKYVYLMSFSEHKGNHVVISEDKDELSVVKWEGRAYSYVM
jgi:hypothetical protein